MNLRALKDLSLVAVVTGMVANIRSEATMDGMCSTPMRCTMHPSQCIIVDSCLAQLSEQFQGGSAIVSKFSLLLSEYINMVSMFKQGDHI
jgi:hypothetical protein